MSALFTVPISPLGPHVGGTITCTQPQPLVYLLTFSSPPDNRITTPFCRAFLTALDILEFDQAYPPGVVVTTSAIPKFYSNGLDLGHAVETPGFWALLYSVWARLLTYPMPTVALLNGHAFAAGFMTAMAHDYRLAPRGRGFLCVNELQFGAHLKPAMAAIFREKLGAGAVYRDMVLEAKRFTGDEALKWGVVDGLAGDGISGSSSSSAKPSTAAKTPMEGARGSEATTKAPTGAAGSNAGANEAALADALKFINARQLVEMPKSGVYGALKAEMWKDLILYLKNPTMDDEERRFEAVQRADGERREFGKVWLEERVKEAKAKL